MLISRVTLQNLLSFRDATLELQPLNVLIGPNASGKTNFIDAISLLRAAPNSLQSAIINGGGVRYWKWLGDPQGSPEAVLECEIRNALAYRLEFVEAAQGLSIVREFLSAIPDGKGEHFFDRIAGKVTFRTNGEPQESAIAPQESVLEGYKSPVDPTPISSTGREFEAIQIFREFRTGTPSGPRYGVSTNIRKDYLNDGGDNLALVLTEFDFRGAHEKMLQYLKRFCDRFEDVRVRLDASIAQTWLREGGLLEPIPPARISDGTLKFLCLLAVLLHPDPATLICIEEPEIGLHPEAIQVVADALVEASGRTQLIVTTHSEALVDALSGQPESVVMCERDPDARTQLRRLSRGELDLWLERYTLGELWRKGELGGTRW